MMIRAPLLLVLFVVVCFLFAGLFPVVHCARISEEENTHHHQNAAQHTFRPSPTSANIDKTHNLETLSTQNRILQQLEEEQHLDNINNNKKKRKRSRQRNNSNHLNSNQVLEEANRGAEGGEEDSEGVRGDGERIGGSVDEQQQQQKKVKRRQGQGQGPRPLPPMNKAKARLRAYLTSYQQLLQGSNSPGKGHPQDTALLTQKKKALTNLISPTYEPILASLEQERVHSLWQSIQQQAKREGFTYELYGFYHISTWKPYWKEVVAEQLSLLLGERSAVTASAAAASSPHSNQTTMTRYTSLLSLSHGLYVNIVGKSRTEFEEVKSFINTYLERNYPDSDAFLPPLSELTGKIVFNFNYTLYRDEVERMSEREKDLLAKNLTEISSGEYPTLMTMRGFCRAYVRRNDLLHYEREKERGRERVPPVDGRTVLGDNPLPDYPQGHYDAAGSLFDQIRERQWKGNRDKENEKEKEKKAIVYYFHNKGGCCFDPNSVFTRRVQEIEREIEREKGRGKERGKGKRRERGKDRGRQTQETRSVIAWREYMNTFILEFPSICLNALTTPSLSPSHLGGGYSICGVDIQTDHISGNFFYSSCEHISALPSLYYRYDFREGEFFISQAHMHSDKIESYSRYCSYSMFHCNRNLYDVPCTRKEDYLMKVVENLIGLSVDVDSSSVVQTSSSSNQLSSSSSSSLSPSLSSSLSVSSSLSSSFYLPPSMSLHQSGKEHNVTMLTNYCQALQTPSQYLSMALRLPNAKQVLKDTFGLSKEMIEKLMAWDQEKREKKRRQGGGEGEKMLSPPPLPEGLPYMWRKLYTQIEPLVVYFAHNHIIPDL